MSYALHNVWELIIMQMRHKAGISKRGVKEGGDENPAKTRKQPNNDDTWTQDSLNWKQQTPPEHDNRQTQNSHGTWLQIPHILTIL